MKRVKTILAFLVVISIMGTGLMGYAQPNAIDKIEIKEAFETGFILLNFTEKEEGKKLEVKITKKLSMPLIIVINEGTTTFKGWDVEIISIFTDREIKLDLSRKIEDSIVFPQTGTTHITSISTKCSFGKDTAMVFKKIQYSQDQVIEGIIAALKDEFDRKGAVIALVEIGDERAVEPLIATLRNEDGDVREAAAEALGKIGDERAVEPLKQALKDKSKDVQIWAAFGLYKLGDTQKIEFLITALKDESGNVRQAAALALGELKDPRAVEPLITALKDGDVNVRSGAAWALGELKDPRAVEPLISALKDENSGVRKVAAEVLGELKDPRAVEPLISALKDESGNVRQAAARVLGELKDPRAVEPLISALKDGDVRYRVAVALEEINPKWRETEEAKRKVSEFISALKDENSGVRKVAAEVLGELKDPRAVEPLISALKDESGNVRQAAARVLGELKDPRAVEPLISALKDGDVRYRVAAALEKITGKIFGEDEAKWRDWYE